MSITPIQSPRFVPKIQRHRQIDRGFTALTQSMAWAIAALLLSIVIIVGIQALPMTVGTLASAAIGLGLAIPLGIGTAVFLGEAFLPSSIRTALVFLVELLAAIPSVVYGLWGIFVLIPLIKPIEQ